MRQRGTGWLALSAAALALLVNGPGPCPAADDSTDIAAPSAAVDPAPDAAQDEPGIELTGGSVKGAGGGKGTASVEARVTNHSRRKLLGVRLAAYYDVIDALPAADARWHLHEFLFEPALAAGGASAVGFSDEEAGEFVLLRIVYARFALGLAVDGGAVVPAQDELVERDGVQYIAARDLAGALGAALRVGDRKQVTLSRPRTAGHSPAVLEYTAGQPGFKQGTAAGQWQHPPFEQNGRGYLPLQESLALLGYDADYDAGANLLTLTTK